MPLPVPRRPLRSRRAFTLIELLVVIVIIATLTAIAIPAYLSQQRKANDSEAKQYLTIAWKSARAELVSNGGSSGYPSPTTLSGLLAQDQPQLTFTTGSEADATVLKRVVIDSASTSSLLKLYTLSRSGDIWELDASATSDAPADGFTDLGSSPTYAATVLADGPVGYWQLDDQSGSTIAAGAGPDGSIANCSAGCLGQPGPHGSSSIGFAATTTITVPYSTALNPAGAFTAEMWVQPGDTTSQHYLIKSDNGNCAVSTGFEIYMQWTAWYAKTFSGCSEYDVADGSAAPPVSGTWTYVVLIYDPSASDKLKLIVNDKLVSRLATASYTPNGSGTPLYIGSWNQSQGFGGDIADVAIYNKALTCGAVSIGGTCSSGSQVDNHYHAG